MSVNAIKDSLSSIEFLPVQNYENVSVLGFETSNLNDFDFLAVVSQRLSDILWRELHVIRQ